MTTEITTNEEAVEQILRLLRYFKKIKVGNPFNYNRGFEFLQAHFLGFELLPVGGGVARID